MKPFDKAAAMRGARVCTRDGQPVRILCFDLRDPDWPIIAAYRADCGIENVGFYAKDGRRATLIDTDIDLMMTDDDYLEKMDRGEYDTPATPAAHIPDPAPSPDPWDEFKRQAALELIRIMGAPIGSRYVTDIVEKVNGIADGLKSK